MENLQEELVELLGSNDIYVTDGILNKTKIVEAVLKVEPGLIKILSENDRFRKHFFTDADGILVFDKIAFQRFVSNRSFLPDSYTAFKNKIGLTINDETVDNFISKNNDVVLAWPHKDCLLEGGQTKDDQKRNEIFWNETLTPDTIDRLLSPKVIENFRRVTSETQENVDSIKKSDNLVLKGNNLMALSSLLKIHRSNIRVIYIDPPYNTGGGGDTFSYNNSFKRSTWLTFMKNRLVLAKQLLKKDGVLITAIDDHEFASLRLLLEELFPEYTHETVVVNHHPQGSGGLNISATHEYAIFTIPKGQTLVKGEYIEEAIEEWSLVKSGAGDDYFRIGRPNMFCAIFVDKDSREVKGIGPALKVDDKYPTEDTKEGWKRVYPIDGSGNERRWRYSRETLLELHEKGEIICSKSGNYSMKVKKIRKDVFKPIYSNWTDKKYNAGPHGTALIKKLVEGTKFSFPKSLYTVLDAIKSIIQDDKNAIVLDYHAGSGTTGHAVMELNKMDGGNRQFILCEQMDYIETVTVPRLQSASKDLGSPDFVYAELKKYNQQYIDKIQNCNDKKELLSLWEEMSTKAFLSYLFDKKLFKDRIEAFKTETLENMKLFLVEILDKNQLYVNYSEIEDSSFEIDKKTIELNHQFYNFK